jgi:MFS transporter, DHA2 family, multidrug resistance protein
MTTGPARADWRTWTALAVLSLPTLLVSMDASILLLALPRIGESLNANGLQQVWIMSIYGFVLSGFLVTMGTLGDRIGSRRLLLVGSATFGSVSFVAAHASSPDMLIGCRAVLGVAGGTVMPSGYALVRNMFHDDRQRSVAFAIFISCVMAGGTVGLVIGGLLLQHFWWGSAFMIGLPVMALLLITGPFLLPENRNPDANRVDLISVMLSLLAILPIVFWFDEASQNGLQPVPALIGLAGAACAVLFVRRELRLSVPLLDLRLFRGRTFTSALAIMLVGSFLSAGIMLLFVQYLQLVKGLSPLRAGLWLLLPSVATTVGVMIAPFLARRLRAAYVIAIGLLVAALGLTILTQIGISTQLWVAMGAVVCIGLGVGPFVMLATEMIQGAVPPQKAGSAGAVSQTSGEGGVALGTAVLGGIGFAVYGSKLVIPAGVPAGLASTAKQSIASAAVTATRLPAAQGHALLASARSAFSAGLNLIAVIVAIIAAGLAILAATMLRDAKRPSEGIQSQENVQSQERSMTGREAPVDF